MCHAARSRVLLVILGMVLFALPLCADDVTVSGTVNFSSLDGSSLDHDGAANGTFTVDDGNLTVLGTINCLDDGSGNNSACPMSFAVSGNFTMLPGSAIFAENRRGGGTGGNISITVGGQFSMQSSGPFFLNGAVISSANEGTPAGGNITINVGGTTTFAPGTYVDAGSKGGQGGAILVQSGGKVTANGLIASAPSRLLNLTSRYTGDVVNGGSNNAKGGAITLRSTTNTEPGVVINGLATIVSQGEGAGSSRVLVEGCGIEIRGLVASVAKGGSTSAVSVRSGTTLLVDTRDLVIAIPADLRSGVLRADSTSGNAASYKADLFAPAGIQVLGPNAFSPFFSVTSNPGGNNATGGAIRVMSTDSTVTASGNAFRAGDTGNNDNGGSINISAKGNVTLNTATIKAIGGNNGKGGSIAARSYAGSVTWQNGVGDARPTGSAVAAPKRGTISLTYCTTVSTSGSSFPTNGSPVGPYPTTTNSCSPGAPSLPVGETVPNCNDAPVAVNDAYTVAEGGTLNVPPPGVLGNDTDADGDPLTASLVSGPAHAASFTFNADGSFNYVHDGSETTTDSFTYTASDGSLTSNTATVTITITPVNDPPVANNDNYSLAEGGTINLAAPGVLVNDTDPDGPALTAVLVTGPAHASSFTLNPNGSFVYVHDGSETTTDSFTYQASDGSLLSNVATASITITPVNDAPVANNDGPYTVAEGGTFTLPAPGVLANDTDSDSLTLTAVLVSGPANASSFALNADGSFTYVHNGGETTSDSFTYRANDGSAHSNVATVSINITAVNDAPVANNDGPYTVAEGGTFTLPAPGVLANDTDSDSLTLTAVLVSGPANASSFALNADGSFTYVHNGGETTSDSFTYMANDGSANSNVATVSITITAVNDAPVANNDGPYTVAEGGTFTLPAPGVLGNDTDAENNSLTAILVTGPANASSFTLNADGSFTYVHNGGETTSDSFTYMANDGSANSNVATVSITITAVNDAPTAVNDGPYTVAEGGTFTLVAPGVLGNDTDPENDALNAVLVTGPANASSFALNADGSFTYVHNGSETTSDSFTYMANDGSANSNVATVTITITPVNDAPVAVNDAYNVNEGGTLTVVPPGVLGNDTDAENNSLTAVLVSGPANATSFTLNADGSFTYVHNGSETLTDSFTYMANDGSANSNVATVTITINPVNDAPVANNDGPYSVGFHGTINVPAPGVLTNDTDPENDGLIAVLVSSTTQGTLTLNPDGSFQYTHTGATLGTDSFTYRAQDTSGAQSAPATVTINIVNVAPTPAGDSFLGVGNTELRVGTGPAAHPAVVVSGGVLANDTDPDSGPSPLTVTAFDATSAGGGSVAMLPNGTFNYLPPVGFVGVDSFNYTVSDGIDSATATVVITLAERVWYVNPVAAGPQTGRSTDPFMTIGQAQAASAVNDYIHVAQGAQATGILLKNGQRLIGSGVPLIVGPYTLAGATVRPTLGSTVILASGNTVAGLNVSGIGVGISGNAVAGGTILEVGITGGADGLTLTNTTGTFTLTNVSVAPGGVGVTINGGTANVTATNLTITTTGATGLLGTGTGTLTVNGGSVTTTNGTAVSLTNHNLAVAFTSVSASNFTSGISLSNTTGAFAVNGTGATAGSGGTIQNMSQRGGVFSSASNVTLKNMNFLNAATTNGTPATTCGDTLNATNGGCNAALHFVNVSGVTLGNVLVDGSAQIGINGNNVTGLSMNNVEVRNAGNEVLEHGVQFANLFGTVTVTGSNFHNNLSRQFTIQNGSGTMSASISGSTFNGNGVLVATGAQGALISANGSANMTVNVQSSTFTNNFALGYHSDTAGTSVMAVTINNSTSSNNGAGGILVSAAGSSTITQDLTNNTAIGNGSGGLIVSRSGAANTSGTISGNIVGNPLVAGSGCSVGGCDGIGLNGTGSGTMSVTVSGNQVAQISGTGIRGNVTSGSSTMNLKFSGNTVSNPNAGALNGIFVQSGAVGSDTTSVCADIVGNSISGAYGSTQIRVRNRFAGTTFRLPGYAGAGNDVTAVAAFLSGQNGGATASATINANIFGGGAACPTP